MFPMNEQFTTAFKAVFPFNGQFTGQFADAAKNVFPANEQFVSVARNNIETQVAYLNALTAKVLESAAKVMDLTLTAVKASVEESTVITKQLLASKDPQEVMSLVSALPQP